MWKNEIYYMKEALREAKCAFVMGEVPVGVVVVVDQRIIARACNRVEALQDPTAHAEVLAIGAATQWIGAKFLPDAILYVSVEPCIMCWGAILHAHIRKVIWGCAAPKCGYSEKFISPSYMEVRGGVMAEEAATLMQSFFKERRE